MAGGRGVSFSAQASMSLEFVNCIILTRLLVYRAVAVENPRAGLSRPIRKRTALGEYGDGPEHSFSRRTAHSTAVVKSLLAVNQL
jgi:hypothetical protein